MAGVSSRGWAEIRLASVESRAKKVCGVNGSDNLEQISWKFHDVPDAKDAMARGEGFFLNFRVYREAHYYSAKLFAKDIAPTA